MGTGSRPAFWVPGGALRLKGSALDTGQCYQRAYQCAYQRAYQPGEPPGLPRRNGPVSLNGLEAGLCTGITLLRS